MGHGSPKYWIGELKERNGEYEYKSFVLLKAPSLANAKKKLTDWAREWYGEENKPKIQDGGYYFNAGEVHVSVVSVTQISKECYDELSQKGIL